MSIGVTSYDGNVFYGITADRDLLPDADLFGACVTEALEELLNASTTTRTPRGRRRTSGKGSTARSTARKATE